MSKNLSHITNIQQKISLSTSNTWVSLRCRMVVKEELKKLGLHYLDVDLGMIEMMEDITSEQHVLTRLAIGPYRKTCEEIKQA